MRDSRIADSASETFKIAPYPVSGSTPLTISIIPANAVFGKAVRNPALPTIDFSINALQGHTVTQWPHDTQLDSPIGFPPSHRTRGCGSSQRIESVSLTSTFWQASTQRPHKMH